MNQMQLEKMNRVLMKSCILNNLPKLYSVNMKFKIKTDMNITLVFTGTISSLNLPEAVAAAARLCDST